MRAYGLFVSQVVELRIGDRTLLDRREDPRSLPDPDAELNDALPGDTPWTG